MNWIYIKGGSENESDVLVNMNNINFIQKTEDATVFHMVGGHQLASPTTEFRKLRNSLMKITEGKE